MKKSSFAALSMVLVMTLAGCSVLPSGNKSSKKDKEKKQVKDTENEVSEILETTTAETTLSEESQESAEQMPTQGRPADTYQDSLINKIPRSADNALGGEDHDIVVNGRSIRLQAVYVFDSADFESETGFAYYWINHISDDPTSEVLDVGRIFFDKEYTKFIREEANGDELILTDVFYTDFKTAAFKGKDKEYIVFSIPAGWEKDSSTMVIATEEGILLANMQIDKSSKITLTGDDADKYKDKNGYCNFFSFSQDSITYLKVSEIVDGVTYFKEYSVSIENNKVISSETGKTYQTNDKVPEITGITVY